MDTFALLMRQAVIARDTAIRDARRDYRIATQEIRALRRRLKIEKRGRPKQREYDQLIATGGDDSCHGMTVIGAVDAILSEGKRLTLVELVIEVQRRGCRSRDDSRAVAKAIRSSLYYRKDRFKRDRAMRWGVA